ncbi:Uncharacterized RNA-binding protein C25G10.01 [Triticum urartu]|uniref:Uncharacterized RNA-binding protein C25G10.01 n=1 Tax=Triticum urartu TaxID=4572 RepID=M7ZG98_TRIUA|nr:Uncharacterized RNA-binding protein C25G10.01 [Triticum urartu]
MEERERAPAVFYLEGEHSGDEEARESGRGDSRGRGGDYGGDRRERGAPDGRDDEMAERWRRRPDLGDAAPGLLGKGKGVGAMRKDARKLVDNTGGEDEAPASRDQGGTAAAEASSGEKRRGPRTLVGEEAWGEAGEVKRDSGTPYIAEGKALELTSELEQCSNEGARSLEVGADGCLLPPCELALYVAAFEGPPAPDPAPAFRRLDITNPRFTVAAKERDPGPKHSLETLMVLGIGSKMRQGAGWQSAAVNEREAIRSFWIRQVNPEEGGAVRGGGGGGAGNQRRCRRSQLIDRRRGEAKDRDSRGFGGQGRSRSGDEAKMSYSRYRSRSRSVDSSDVENPGNNLFVTGLSSRLTDQDLEKHFSTEGEVIDASIVLDPWTRESRGFGFVTMATLKEAERCIKYLDRSVLEGRVITVEKQQVDARSCLASIQKIHNLRSKQCYLNQRVVRPPLLFFLTIYVLQIPNNLFGLAFDIKHKQSEDEVEPQHREGIWAPNHRVEGGIPEAGHLLGETVTAHATRLSENALILLIAEDDHTLVVTGVDHTLLPTGRSLPTTGEGPTHRTTGACLTHPTMVTATVQDLHTVTVGGGRAPTTVLFQHTTAGAILQGAEDGATLAAYRHAGATPAAAPRRQKNQGAVLRGKDAPEARHRAAGHLGRGVPEKAMLTAAVHARVWLAVYIMDLANG